MRLGQSARDQAAIKLPAPAATDRLLRSVWSNAKAFECVPENPHMVRYLQRESAYFCANFAVDRSPERWVFTQHPGGWLRRRTEGQAESSVGERRGGNAR